MAPKMLISGCQLGFIRVFLKVGLTLDIWVKLLKSLAGAYFGYKDVPSHETGLGSNVDFAQLVAG